jgi:hypothetical protein
MIKQSLGRAVVGMALVVGAHAAFATPITFTVSGATATTYGVSIGSTVSVTPKDLAGYSFDLNEGGSNTFDFLDVKVSGVGAAAGLIDAALNFSSPTASANGILGGFAVLLGIGSTGEVSVLNDPGQISFDNDGLFDVDFLGFKSSCLWCSTLEGTVQARVSLVKAPTSAPEPGTLSLLGAGLVAAALARRRRKVSLSS